MTSRRSFLAAVVAAPVLGRLFKFQTISQPDPFAYCNGPCCGGRPPGRAREIDFGLGSIE